MSHLTWLIMFCAVRNAMFKGMLAAWSKLDASLTICSTLFGAFILVVVRESVVVSRGVVSRGRMYRSIFGLVVACSRLESRRVGSSRELVAMTKRPRQRR